MGAACSRHQVKEDCIGARAGPGLPSSSIKLGEQPAICKQDAAACDAAGPDAIPAARPGDDSCAAENEQAVDLCSDLMRLRTTLEEEASCNEGDAAPPAAEGPTEQKAASGAAHAGAKPALESEKKSTAKSSSRPPCPKKAETPFQCSVTNSLAIRSPCGKAAGLFGDPPAPVRRSSTPTRRGAGGRSTGGRSAAGKGSEAGAAAGEAGCTTSAFDASKGSRPSSRQNSRPLSNMHTASSLAKQHSKPLPASRQGSKQLPGASRQGSAQLPAQQSRQGSCHVPSVAQEAEAEACHAENGIQTSDQEQECCPAEAEAQEGCEAFADAAQQTELASAHVCADPEEWCGAAL